MIASKDQLEQAALSLGMLPFFSNPVPGFSVEEMAAPGMLFGDTRDDYGCWEWKGPVIQEQTTAYGKFFKRKAGFVSLELLPDFLNYRRGAYPLAPDTPEQMILDIIRQHEGMSSTELRRVIFDRPPQKRTPADLVDTSEYFRPRRHSLEAPLQRLQMGGRLLIADFEYKRTAAGRRYGWGVALYSTPEIWFGRTFDANGRTPAESFNHLIDTLSSRLPSAPRTLIASLIR